MALINNINQNLITPSNLKKVLRYKKIKILDCRWYLEDKKKGYLLYRKKHIPGAIFFDIEKISDTKSDLPHMFPSINVFIEFVNKFGINKNSVIVIYDQVGFFSSSRVWFLFKYFGFYNVKIMDGGFKLWNKKKYKTESLQKKIKYARCYSQITNLNLLIDKKSLIEKIKNKKSIIIDARPESRYKGKIDEPRPNLRKGKIKNSVNIFFGLITNELGCLKKKYKLVELFRKFNKKKEIISYCGSGITACNIIFVLYILNFKKVKLYDGSWAEWGREK